MNTQELPGRHKRAWATLRESGQPTEAFIDRVWSDGGVVYTDLRVGIPPADDSDHTYQFTRMKRVRMFDTEADALASGYLECAWGPLLGWGAARK